MRQRHCPTSRWSRGAGRYPEDPEVLASMHKTTLAVLRRLGAQGIVRQGTAPTGARTWARS